MNCEQICPQEPPCIGVDDALHVLDILDAVYENATETAGVA